MSSISPLFFLQRFLTQYVMTIYIILGSFGLICNIIIFLQPAHRRHSCSLYISAASICGLIGMYLALVPTIYGLNHSNPITSSIVLCQLQFYLVHVFNQSMRTYIVIACADRYATCSNRVAIRSLSCYQIAIRIIPFVFMFWTLLAIFPMMMRSLVNGVCDALPGIHTIIYSIYVFIVVDIFPLVTMITFGILMIRSLKQMRRRIRPQTTTNTSINNQHIFRKRDRDMMKMLLMELSVYIITTTPWTIALVYKSLTQTIIKTNEQQDIESFIYYFTRLFLLYLNNSVPFWIYILTSQSFRMEFQNLIQKFWNFIIDKLRQINIIH